MVQLYDNPAWLGLDLAAADRIGGINDNRKSGCGIAVAVAAIVLVIVALAFAWLAIFGIRGGPAP